MKKVLSITLVLVMIMGLIGCGNGKMKYEIREDYQGKIREELADTFISFTKDMEKIHKEKLDKVKILDEEVSELSEHMWDTTSNYEDFLVGTNLYEEKVLEIMMEQSDIMFDIMDIRLKIGTDKYQTEEDLKEDLLEIKEQIEDNLEKAKIYIE